MAKSWNSRGRNHRWDSKDPWQPYREPESNFGWLIRTVIAALVFALVYGAYVSETSLSRTVADAVKYVLATETDFVYLADTLTNYAPKNMDVSVLKRVQNTVTKPADPLLYMVRPVDGKLVSPFGWQVHPILKQEMMHEGIDLEASLGSPVKAAAAGKVKTVTDSAQYGKMLIIEHSQEVDSVYGHLSEVLVKADDMVTQGQVVARVGKTGIASTPMLYFEVREKGTAVDPLPRFKDDPGKEGR
ncbi:MAG TPA: M23 family metallopeptidase [Selenomonadales bacterium]|nr:M23 family metallopeptidase [Selenomonadales bacterium]